MFADWKISIVNNYSIILKKKKKKKKDNVSFPELIFFLFVNGFSIKMETINKKIHIMFVFSTNGLVWFMVFNTTFNNI